MNWHKRLTQAREARSIKKSAFAKMVRVSAPTVTDWENGDTKNIEGANLIRVCEALHIEPSWLLYGDGEMPEVEAMPAAKEEVKPSDQPNYAWLNADEMRLITLYRTTNDRDRADIMDRAESAPRVIKSPLSLNKS